MPDVVVIGSGLAGTVAALALKKNGADVALATRSWGVTSMSTGALDLAYSPALSPSHNIPRTIAEHIMDIVAHRRRHPYAVMGVTKTIENMLYGWDVFQNVLEGTGLDVGAFELEKENGFYLSGLGVACPAACALGPHAEGELSGLGGKRVGLLGIRGYSGFIPSRIKAGLNHDIRALGMAAPVWVDIEVDIGVVGRSIVLAKALDQNSTCAALMDGLAGLAGKIDCLITPPVLGLDSHIELRQRLSDVVQAPVVEAVGSVPSVPGIRLQRVLDQACTKMNIHRYGEVVQVSEKNRRVDTVQFVGSEGVSVGGLVMASGRFVSGGVRWGETCKESLLGLPLISELGPLEVGSPHSVVRRKPEESHPLMTAGVMVNEEMRPMREGDIAFENVFAAGMLIGGFASRYALCADGVALSTGWAAAQGVLGEVS